MLVNYREMLITICLADTLRVSISRTFFSGSDGQSTRNCGTERRQVSILSYCIEMLRHYDFLLSQIRHKLPN